MLVQFKMTSAIGYAIGDEVDLRDASGCGVLMDQE